jgi:putative ABC transport system ATP-binding protein
MQLQIKNLLPTYFEADRTLTSEIWGKDLRFGAGELVKIIAPSGSGKSSLVNFLYGMRADYSGDISFDTTRMRNIPIEELAVLRKDHISIVFQDLRLFPTQTVLQNLEIKRQLNPFHSTSRIQQMAQKLGIESKLNSLAGTCSYGEQQRVAIIRALQQPFNFLLLDEPFSHLDTNNGKLAMELILAEAKERNATVILADLEQVGFYPYTKLLHL